MNQRRVIHGEALDDHPAHGITHEVRVPDAEGLHGGGQILRHVADGEAEGRLRAARKDIDRVVLCGGGKGCGDGVGLERDVRQVHARNDHQRFAAAAEADIAQLRPTGGNAENKGYLS